MFKEKMNPHMDERMLWIRGNVFKHSFIAALVLIGANAVVQDVYGHWADPWNENLLILVTLVVTTSLEMIIRGVYVTSPPATQRTAVILMGVCGLVLLGLSIKHLLVDGDVFWGGAALTKTACGLAMGLMILLIPIAHFVQEAVQKRRQAAEED